MAKVTKKMLKGIVRECLVEILSEGLGDTDVMTESVSRKRSSTGKKKSIFDEMDQAFERESHSTDHTTFDKRASQAAEAATSDPMLQSILTDTAKTTLQEQLQHESRIPTVPQMGVTESSDLRSTSFGGGSAGLDIGSLFGEASKNWSEVLERTERKPL
jgi:hypothetical protein